MTIGDLLAALRDLDAMLYVDAGGTLRYAGPKLPADDPVRACIAEHRALLIELFTYAPGGRCAGVGCYRLKAPGKDLCPWPHLLLGDLEAMQGGMREEVAA